MSGLFLKHLAYLGPRKEPASVSFERGLNVVCGASDTGKSLIVESLDFMLGGTQSPREVPERAGYDRVRLLIESEGWPLLGLERSIEGGNFASYEEELLDGQPSTNPRTLREKHSAARQDTLSHELLDRIGLTEKYLRRNKAGATRTVSIRDIARLSVVTEEEIQRRSSPFLTGQFTQATPEYATFKLLLSGTDDSALIGTAEAGRVRESVSGKVELLTQMIEELQIEIDEEGHDQEELLDQFSKLEGSIKARNDELSAAQGNLNTLIEDRAAAASEINERRARLVEITELTNRFALLDDHYSTDLTRLESIREAGSLFVYSDRKLCPLCGSNPEDQHLETDCDGNVEAILQAAIAEMDKIKKLQSELRDTVATLESERDRISDDLPDYSERYALLDGELSDIAKPNLSTKRSSYNELISKRAEVNSALEKFKRLKRLIDRRDDLEAGADGDGKATETKTIISKSTLDDFSQTVERILAAWHYPNAQRVFFDETTRDFQIAGKARGSSGKGLRAISHAAVTLGLLEFCLERGLPHPGFVVLDSPLLAYWKPEGEDDDLRGTDIKERFYEYLIGFKDNAQIIIVENEHPPSFVAESANVLVFTKNPSQGRYGFFPVPL